MEAFGEQICNNFGPWYLVWCVEKFDAEVHKRISNKYEIDLSDEQN